MYGGDRSIRNPFVLRQTEVPWGTYRRSTKDNFKIVLCVQWPMSTNWGPSRKGPDKRPERVPHCRPYSPTMALSRTMEQLIRSAYGVDGNAFRDIVLYIGSDR